MQKSCRKVLQHQVRSKTRLRTNFGPFWEGSGTKFHPKSQKRLPKAHAKKLQIFGMRKKRQKWAQGGQGARPEGV